MFEPSADWPLPIGSSRGIGIQLLTFRIVTLLEWVMILLAVLDISTLANGSVGHVVLAERVMVVDDSFIFFSVGYSRATGRDV